MVLGLARTEGAHPINPMSFRGALSTLALTDVLQVLSQGKKTGVLTVKRHDITKILTFDSGIIVSALSNEPCERLGQYLLSRGHISEDDLSKALEYQERYRRYLGTILVRMGVLTSEKLTTLLIEAAEEIIYSLFDWQQGNFEFHPSERVETQSPVVLQVEHVFLKGLKRHDQLNEIRQVFPNSRTVLRRTEKPPGRGVLKNQPARDVYAMLDGQKTIAEIALATHSSEFVVSWFLFGLYRQELVEVASTQESPYGTEAPDGAESGGPSTTRSIEEGQGLLDKGQAEEALEIFQRAHRAEPERTALRSLVELAEIRLLEKLYREHVPVDGVPCIACDPNEMMGRNLTPEGFFLVSRMDGTTDVRALVKLSPLRELDVVRMLKGLLDRGVIELAQQDAAKDAVQVGTSSLATPGLTAT